MQSYFEIRVLVSPPTTNTCIMRSKNQPSIAFRVLSIPEILLECCHPLARDGALRSIRAMALTCHDLKNPALSVLWAQPVPLSRLMETLPTDVFTTDGTIVVSSLLLSPSYRSIDPANSQSFTQPLPGSDASQLKPFDWYRVQVRHLVVGPAFNMPMSSVETFLHWHKQRHNQPLMPRLTKLEVHVHAESSTLPETRAVATLRFLHAVFNSRITTLQLRINGVMMNILRRLQFDTAINREIDALLSKAKEMEDISVTVDDDIPQAVITHLCNERLRKVHVKVVNMALPTPNLHALSALLPQLPALQSMALDAPDWQHMEEPSHHPSHTTHVFPGLQSIHLTPSRFLALIPAPQRGQLVSLTMNAIVRNSQQLERLVGCFVGCPNLQQLAINLELSYSNSYALVEFPWDAVYSLHLLESFALVDHGGSLRTPSDCILERLVSACPKLAALSWNRERIPHGVKQRPRATLDAFTVLSSSLIAELDIPIIVRGAHQRREVERFTSRDFTVRYDDWFYEPIEKASTWIQDVLKAVCPRGASIRKWLKVDHKPRSAWRAQSGDRDMHEHLWTQIEKALELDVVAH